MSFGGSMFGDMIEWFLGRAGDRRQYKRRAGAFHLWYLPNPKDESTHVKGVGIEVSPNGLAFLCDSSISAHEYTLVAFLRDAKIPLRVRAVRNDVVSQQGKTWNRYMVTFLGVAADHWDTIVRYVNDEPEPDRRKMQNQEINDKIDDAYRMLPLVLQEKIVAMLIAQNKLDEPKGGQTPLLKLFYGGLMKRPGQKPAHRFNVHSRIKKGDEMIAYDTRFLVGEDGEITLL